MAKAKKPPVYQSVDEFIGLQPAPFNELITAIRKLFLKTDKTIAEIIKWNAPCFIYTGEMKAFNPKEYKRDIAVVNIQKASVLIVFPTGAVVKDSHGVLEGTYTDGRRLARINDLSDLQSKEKGLQKVLKEWLAAVDK